MKKVAIVGVEGSGKTVMLAGLGDLYTYPDEEGYFLTPKNFGTAAYVAEKIERMRKGEWPAATAGDEMQGLNWTLSRQTEEGRGRPVTVCEVSFLDFPGEVYRAAYGISNDGYAALKEQAEVLKQYVCGADELIVLINLRDVITHGLRGQRVQEAMWITKAILDTALRDAANKNTPRAAIVLSQSDSYAETIEACGGSRGVLKKYLPYVANEYGWLDIFAANAVDKTELDDDGNVVPAPDFTAKGLRPIVGWFLGGNEGKAENGSGNQPSGSGWAAGVNGVAIEQFLSSVENVYGDLFFPSSPKFQAKLNNMIQAVKAKCNLDASGDEAIALLDCTVFGSAKNGVLFCRSGFYTLNDWAGSVNGFVSWTDFVRKGNVRKDGSYNVLLTDAPSVGIDVSGSAIKADQAVELFTNLQKIAGGSR